MKKMKKLASILLAAIMVLAMAVPGMATDEPVGTQTGSSVTAESLKGHKFVAYQIFTGEPDGDGRLGNIKWGNGIDVEQFVSALKTKGILKDNAKEYTAYEVSEAIEEEKDSALEIAKIADEYVEKTKGTTLNNLSAADNKITVNDTLPAGYYIIVDETSGNNGENAIFNLSLLQVSGKGDLEIYVKTDIPSVEKDVQDDDNEDDKTDLTGLPDDTNNTSLWGETADYDIGDHVPFRLKATIPTTVNLSQYETYQVIFHDTMSASLTYDNNIVSITCNGTDVKGKVTDITYSTDGDGVTTLTITIPNIMELDGFDIARNTEIEVQYTATLNDKAILGPTLEATENNNEVKLEYSNNPNGEGTGTTKEDDVYVFTFEIPGKKVDQDKEALAGAKFALYKTVDENTRKYAKLKEDGCTFDGWVEATKGNDGKFTLPKEAGEVTASADGLFSFKGLDADTYTLQETLTPKGYNTAPDTDVTISATNQHELSSGTSAEATVTVSPVDEGTGKVTIVNNQGAQLPETGGIGTTIFYVLGSILVLGAVILLVTRRRMNVEK